MPDYVENVILAMGRRFRLPIRYVTGGRGFCHIFLQYKHCAMK